MTPIRYPEYREPHLLFAGKLLVAEDELHFPELPGRLVLRVFHDLVGHVRRKMLIMAVMHFTLECQQRPSRVSAASIMHGGD